MDLGTKILSHTEKERKKERKEEKERQRKTKKERLEIFEDYKVNYS